MIWAGLIFLLLLVMVLIFNTFREPGLCAGAGGSAPEHVDEHKTALRLSNALQLKTVSRPAPEPTDPEPFLAFQNLLAVSFPNIRKTLEKTVVNQYSLLYEWPGTSPDLKPVAFLAHMDVVPVEPATLRDWRYPPFSGKIADGFIWGRGAMDMKSTLMAEMEAIESLISQGFSPERTIYLALGHDEETGGLEGAARICAHLEEKGVCLACTLDEGMAVLDPSLAPTGNSLAVIGIGEKGYLNLELTARGKGGHSSTPAHKSAIGRLCRAGARIEKYPMPATLGAPVDKFFRQISPDMPFLKRMVFANQWLFRPLILKRLAKSQTANGMIRTTAALTMVRGGLRDNVIPEQAKLLVNLRILPKDRVEDVLDHMEKTIADDLVDIRVLKGVVAKPGPVSDSGSDEYDKIRRAVVQSFGNIRTAPGLVLGITDSRHYSEISRNQYHFVPFVFNAGDTSRIHGTNERVGLKDYARAIEFYIRLIRAVARP